MRKVALYGTLVVVLARLAHVRHGITPIEHQVPLGAWQWAYVIFMIFLAPVVAAMLLWTRLRRLGTWLHLASMAGALIFGLAFHFFFPDRITYLRGGPRPRSDTRG